MIVLTPTQQAIYNAIKTFGPSSAREIADKRHLSLYTVRDNLTIMHNDGLIKPTTPSVKSPFLRWALNEELGCCPTCGRSL